MERSSRPRAAPGSASRAVARAFGDRPVVSRGCLALMTIALGAGAFAQDATLPGAAPPPAGPPVAVPSPSKPTAPGERSGELHGDLSRAVIVGDRVRLRTGGSESHHPFATLSRGDELLVAERRGDWLRARVPSWIPVYVHADYVNLMSAVADGSAETFVGPPAPSTVGVAETVGVVTADRLVVRIVPDRRHEAVGILTHGAAVTVAGRSGEWLQLRPPAGTYGWVHAGFVGLAGAVAREQEDAVWASLRSGAMVPEDTRPPLASGGGAGTSEAPSAGPAEPAAGRPRGARGEPLPRAADGAAGTRTDEAVSAEAVQPVEAVARESAALDGAWRLLKKTLESGADGEADFAPVKTAFSQLASSSRHADVRRQAFEGLRVARLLEERQAHIRDARAILRRAQERERELRIDTEKISSTRRKGTELQPRKVPPGNSDPYLARGWVVPGGGNRGRPGTHLLTKGGEVLYYLKKDTRLEQPLTSFENMRVGVKGTVQELGPLHSHDLLTVTEVVVLSDAPPGR